MTVDKKPRLIDVRQIGPQSERDISGRCSVCGVVLIARLDNWEDVSPPRLRDKLERVFTRHIAETKCGQGVPNSVPKRTSAPPEFRG